MLKQIRMQKYNRRIENLLNKIYLSRLSISNYDLYYGNLLKHLDFELVDEDWHSLFDDKKFYLKEKFVEDTNPVKISLFIISEFEKYIEEIGVYTDGLKSPSANIRKEGDSDFASNNNDGKREKSKKFWRNKIKETVALLGGEQSIGEIPSNAKIFIKRRFKNNIDWRKELMEYITKDITDYSFNPPDKRYSETDFFLPAFNDETEKMENLLFMFDISNSMQNNVINDVFGEVKNVKEQFRGKIDGYVGWFDTIVRDIKSMDEALKIENINRENIEGTSFVDIFRAKNRILSGIDIKEIIILTDGYGEFPDEKLVGDIPVLWILTNPSSKMPFGRVIRYNKKQNF